MSGCRHSAGGAAHLFALVCSPEAAVPSKVTEARPESVSVADPMTLVEVPVDIGACCVMLRATHEKMGGFSPFFRVWGTNEQDLSARAWLTGLGVKCVTNARVGQVTRSKFPYPVSWEDIGFDRFAMVRTVFEEKTVAVLEEAMRPAPSKVQEWLAQADFLAWRTLVQSNRQMSDAEFFRRFVPDAPSCLLRE